MYLVEAMRWAINSVRKHSERYFRRNKSSRFPQFRYGYRIFDTCKSTAKLEVPVMKLVSGSKSIGTVGPPTTDEAIVISSVTGALGRSVISYSASGTELNDRARYKNFFRMIPADDMQARVLVDILKQYNWNYVSAVNSYGSYGDKGIKEVVKLLKKEGICISIKNALPSYPKKSDFAAVIKNLETNSNARTVILFTTAKDTHGLLEEAAKCKTRFQWLSSTSWDANMQTVEGVKEAAKGAIILSYANNAYTKFVKYFKSLKLNDNRYGWFEEFWERQFNCTVIKRGKTTGRKVTKRPNFRRKNCTGNEDLKDTEFYPKYATASTDVIKAVFVYYENVDCAVQAYCFWKFKAFYCPSNHKFNFAHLANHLTSALITPRLLCKKPFNKYGSTYKDINVINFDGKTYKTIGRWQLNSTSQNGTLKINDTSIVWYHGKKKIPESICSRPCEVGQKKILSTSEACCFHCQDCKKNEILKNNKCIACDVLSIPRKDRSTCKKMPKFHVPLQHHLSILVLIESTIGFILNTIVLIIFVKYKNSKIIKASSRELSYFILAGLYLCFLSPCVFLLEPTKVRCGLRRFIFGISLTACYTPLMLKTNRIYRIFIAARSLGNMPHLVTQKSQILMCFGLLALQLLLCVMWVVGAPPVVTYQIDEEFKMVAYLCKSDILTTSVNLVPCFCMLAASTYYAFKSRKFHKNFNEASNIGITMYISCALWAMLLPLILWVKIEYNNPFGQLFVVANFSNAIGLVSLFGIFGPKLFRLMRFKGNEKHTFFTNVDRSNDGIDNRSLDMHTMGTMDHERRTIDNEERTIDTDGRTIDGEGKTIYDDKSMGIAAINEDIKVISSFDDDFKDRSKTC